MKKILYLNLMIWFTLNVISCAHKIPDEPICIEINQIKGYCTHTISQESYYLLNKEWLNMKSNSLLIPISSWAEIKKFIIKICVEENQCTEDQKINIENKINEIEIKLH